VLKFRSIAASLVASLTGHFGDDFAQLLNHFRARAQQYLTPETQRAAAYYLQQLINRSQSSAMTEII
jgi:hypothetical protein